MKTIDMYRKKPIQLRAEVTIDSIFEAAARILQTQELGEFNTNAVAKLAGVSIGTLYQYFPNKNAILIAMARRELGKVNEEIIDRINNGFASNDSEKLCREVVHTLLKAFGGRQRTRKVLIEALIKNGLSDELSRPMESVILAIMNQQARAQEEHLRIVAPITLYVMSRAVIGAIRAAVMEQSPHLGTIAFEDELVGLLLYSVNRDVKSELRY